jgi:hypothetical protein
MEMTMTYQPSGEVFPSGAVSLHEKMLRLRQEITDAQEYRRRLENAFEHFFGNGHSPLYWRLEKQIAYLRISEMESRLSALLDIYGD